jgi:hypothetical protein
MYFCPKCNYSFDISKSSSNNVERKILDEPHQALKRLKANKNLSNYKAKFTKHDLESHPKYNKLSEDNKHKLQLLFEDTKSFGNIEFKCLNCNYRKKINESIQLYQINYNTKFTSYKSIEDNKLLALNPIYPRTKDYTCKNINCITHKDSTNKEAVFYREKESYQLNYLCTVCYNSWLL